MLRAGVAVANITPDPAMLVRGLHLAGFAARTDPATGIHDPLTARAVVVEDTAIVAADIVALHEETSARIRARCALPDDRVIVTATHTHGAPLAVPGRLGGEPDPTFLQAVEDGCVAAIDAALADQQPARITVGLGADPDVARNRRHADGPVDRALPVLRIRDADGGLRAVVLAYACHPVALGADNRLVTADYPHFVRRRIEAAHPGAVALFLQGCCGDANTGHSARASLSRAPDDARTYAVAERLGARIAGAALDAGEAAVAGPVTAGEARVELRLHRAEHDLPALVAGWKAEAASADPVRAVLLAHWIRWADRVAGVDSGIWTGRVSVLRWGDVPIVALPGEIFGETGLGLRADCGAGPAFVLAYADAVPGYIPPEAEYAHGGYEVDEAHRFFGLPGGFAPQSAERLAEAAVRLLAGDEP
ncbi:MAG: neutral/alkaline non-lysosomal ceramidase N-terminal domain-containing protein [Rhodobacteraceae bacterium]|nr:neutral/alkaline non-lysosomal ceramidase N-terminal domain-containing protein [Paracoccaceae bacterium]